MLSPTRTRTASNAASSGVLTRGRDEGAAPQRPASGDLDGGRDDHEALTHRASVDLPPAVKDTASIARSPGTLDRDRTAVETRGVGVPDSSNGHRRIDAPRRSAVGSDGNGRVVADTQISNADPSDALLLILADQLDDIEKARIAAQNRLRSLRDVKGLEGSKAEATLEALKDDWVVAEKRITLELQRTMRTHRFGPWVKANIGLGEKQAARLIAAIGDPLWNGAEGRPRRGPAELWAYCGYRPDQGKRKGQSHSYNWDAKMRAFLCAESCMKQRNSPFREVYDRERAKWAERDTADAHKHAHALRVVAKEILKDLWRFAAAWSSEPRGVTPAATDLQPTTVPPVSSFVASADLPGDQTWHADQAASVPGDLRGATFAATPGPTPSLEASEVA